MDDERDDYREREERAAAESRTESEDRAETDDREGLGPPVSEEPEPEVYTSEEYELAQEIKARRLYKEEHGRFPYSEGEQSYFLLKAKISLPLRPDDDDLKAARLKLEATGS